MPEAGLEDKTISYTKGCFLGQEVLARVKSQGAPTRGLVGLVFSAGVKTTFPVDSKVATEGGDVAWIKSNCYSPTLKTTIALAFVKRDFRVPDKVLDAKIDGKPYTVTVKMLPFVQSRSLDDRARECYEQALRIYTKAADDAAQAEAVSLLRQALELNPKLEDAYEALGVILHKRGQIDEAIELMKNVGRTERRFGYGTHKLISLLCRERLERRGGRGESYFSQHSHARSGCASQSSAKG